MPLPAGTRVGRYEILDRLGTGGMSEVYRARDLDLGREVAVKALPEGWVEDRERAERFEREAQLLASLRH
ncbi:MAG TPA: serine/threonine protein kinase, partial [Vicinamibacteria bacterium]